MSMLQNSWGIMSTYTKMSRGILSGGGGYCPYPVDCWCFMSRSYWDVFPVFLSKLYCCMLDLILYIPDNNFSVMSGRVFLG